MGRESDGGYYEEFENAARREPPEREELFVSDQYRVFMIACVPNGYNGKRNHIGVRPFHTLSPEACARMRESARPWTEENSYATEIGIHYDDKASTLNFHDRRTQITVHFPVSELDAEARAEMLYKIRVENPNRTLKEIIDPWEKYTTPDTPAKKPEGLKI
jgi:hypothetical protein